MSVVSIVSASAEMVESDEPTEDTWARRRAGRQRQIDIGKTRPEYKSYLRDVPKNRRREGHPHTPDPHAKIPKRQFDRQLSKWRRELHQYDDRFVEDCPSPDTRQRPCGSGCSTVRRREEPRLISLSDALADCRESPATASTDTPMRGQKLDIHAALSPSFTNTPAPRTMGADFRYVPQDGETPSVSNHTGTHRQPEDQMSPRKEIEPLTPPSKTKSRLNFEGIAKEDDAPWNGRRLACSPCRSPGSETVTPKFTYSVMNTPEPTPCRNAENMIAQPTLLQSMQSMQSMPHVMPQMASSVQYPPMQPAQQQMHQMQQCWYGNQFSGW